MSFSSSSLALLVEWVVRDRLAVHEGVRVRGGRLRELLRPVVGVR